jgi:hypothetical protein
MMPVKTAEQTKVRTILYKCGFRFIWISQDVGGVNAFISMLTIAY